ncbi:hypothetical protein ACFO5K_07540 [Nocardia halotolerans]|uniref:Uncharacterized protein n=1 Tax=Nocardia halotolerans TaxID=1755878 RepID=A0ABV8VEP8_9NOCA
MYEEPGEHPSYEQRAAPVLAEIVEGWELPEGAYLTDTIRRGVLAVLEATGIEDGEVLADLAIGPVVTTLGRLEADLADARRRIEDLEAALGRRAG